MYSADIVMPQKGSSCSNARLAFQTDGWFKSSDRKSTFAVAAPGNEAHAARLATRLGVPLITPQVRQFPDGELYVRIDADLAGHAVVLVSRLHEPGDKPLPIAYLPRTARVPGPTRGGLLSRTGRGVVSGAGGGGARPWYMSYFDHAFENPYAARTPSDLSCAVDRGRASNALFVMNHFLTAPLADEALARMVNPDPFLTERVRRCTAERGRPPNFLTVDFYDVGALLPAVEALNAGAWPP